VTLFFNILESFNNRVLWPRNFSLGEYPAEKRMAGCRKLFGISSYIIPLVIILIDWPDNATFKELKWFDQKLVYHNRFTG
jgi:hypothetical protein